MPKPQPRELIEAIEELSAYRDRLSKEVIKVSQKLRMPESKIQATLKNNNELSKIEETLTKLIAEKEKEEQSSLESSQD